MNRCIGSTLISSIMWRRNGHEDVERQCSIIEQRAFIGITVKPTKFLALEISIIIYKTKIIISNI